MATKEVHIIECDECGDFEFDQDNAEQSFESIRDFCKSRGWDIGSTRDLCPRCVE